MLTKLLCSFPPLVPAPVPPPGTVCKAESFLDPCKSAFNSFISILKSFQATVGRFKLRKNLLPPVFGAADLSTSFTAELCGMQISPLPTIEMYSIFKVLTGAQQQLWLLSGQPFLGAASSSWVLPWHTHPFSQCTATAGCRHNFSCLAFSLYHLSYGCSATAIFVKV